MSDIVVVTNTGSVVQSILSQNPVVVQNTGSTIVVNTQRTPVQTTVNQTLSQTVTKSQVVEALTVGPQGPPGASDVTFTVTAGTTLSYPIVVAIDNGLAHPADPTNTSDMTSQLAITTQAASVGTPVLVATSISMTEPLWSWSPGRVYLALSGGQITQTPPSTGALLEVGRAVSATTIEFNIQTAILR